ncbi:MAG: ATP-binding cassette domain-containing protein [Bacilli bacterium]|nr:ATP-binding cassette domain-containing protein [Bacilli bacterium]
MADMLVARDIVKVYGKRTVLKKVNMNIQKGDIYGFIGKNGAGKTTFMRVILSLTYPQSGDVKLFGDKTLQEVGLKVGSLIEAPGIYKNLTGEENLRRFSILYGADPDKAPELLKLVGLNNTGKKKAKDYSLGMRQRLGIAIALIGDPELLLLDEPINGLDPEGIKEIRDLILKLNEEKGITFLISSHLLDELGKVVTKYGIINDGEMLEEIGAEELREKCKQKLTIEVDDLAKAMSIAAKIVKEENLSGNKHIMTVEGEVSKAAELNTALVKGGVAVKAIYPNSDTLEEYFMKRIGE